MAKETLYFYDLETTGINARNDRVVQFAGQRVGLDFKPDGEPDKFLVKVTNDILPDPYAALVTGITPQMTQDDGLTEREFAKFFTDKVATPNTTIVGYNTLRFDNEFIRNLMYRNFYDPYEWSYKNGITAWDILDLVRMARALRPDGIEWPFSPEGQPSNRLELLTAVNKISHEDAHDALSDVYATVAVANLLKTKQPKLYDFLYSIRNKKSVMEIVNTGKPFVYVSGRYPAEYEKTTVAIKLCDHPVYGSSRALVYDLRVDPAEFIKLNQTELVERLAYIKDRSETTPQRLPVKELTFNKCPAIAPLAVLDQKSCQRIKLNLKDVDVNTSKLLADKTFAERVRQAFESAKAPIQPALVSDLQTADSQLYDGFFNDSDKRLMTSVRNQTDAELADFEPNFADDRLRHLLLLYKARQVPKSLTAEEQTKYEEYRRTKLLFGEEQSALAKYFKNIEELSKTATDVQKDLLQDLWYWGESIAPAD